jgi:hypothetical protein
MPAVFVATLAAVAWADDQGAARPVDPGEFVLSYWSGPPAAFTTLQRYREVKEANFTVAFPADGGLSIEQNKKLLDFCQQVGLKAVISDGRMCQAIGGSEPRKNGLDAIIADYGSHPALFGYHIVDEPSAAAFDGLAEVNAYLKEKDPRHPGFVNLFPTYARDFPGALGAASYEEYVRQYVQKVKPFVISYDHYHFTGAGDRPDFFENLDTVRRVSLESKTPFWNIVLLTQHFAYRHLTEAELRFEAMQTLAFGGRGLIWFTYWMPAGVPEPQSWKHSMILADGSRDPHYDQVKRLNQEIKALGDALAGCESTAVFQQGDGATIKSGQPPIDAKDGKLTVGVFQRRADGKTLALVTNRDYQAPVSTSVRVQPAGANVERFDAATRQWSAAEAKDAALPLTIPAGDGVLLRW